VPQAISQAFKFHQEGRLSDAERLYREYLKARPRDFDALHMLGILKLEQGEPDEAARLIAAAIETNRKSAAAHANYGIALAALGRHEEALASYDRALALAPRNADTLSSRADTLSDLGRSEEALANYGKALAINPRLVAALVNRGVLLRDKGRPAEALASHDKALAVASDDAEAWANRGVALHDLGRHTEALASYERALALKPDHVGALFNRGNALLLLKRLTEALTSYGRAVVLKPDFADAHVGCGHALADLGRGEEALMSYDKAIELKSDHFDARIHRARLLGKLDRHHEAIAEYEKLRAARPALPILLNDFARCRAEVCDWSDRAQLAEELTARAVDGRSVIDPFLFLGFEGTAEQQLACTSNWLRHKKVATAKRDWNRVDFSSDRIRIAYLSADYHRHATAYLIAELFELHDRKKFEIVGVSFGPDDGSPIRSRVVKSFDRFFDVTTRTNDDVTKLLRDLKVHIAVDLKGHTTDARMDIMAQRVAPIQASYLGYPGTSGADFIDYVIGDKTVLPFDQQPFYTEKIVHLPDSYQVNDSKRPISVVPNRSEVGLPASAFVFCCFNNAWKINNRTFDIWMRLLKAIDGSVLWLYRANSLAVENLRTEAHARGVDPSRLVFAPQMDLPEHLARLTLADLFLDTLPYNAHTTASDALWAGVPVLTCLGPTFAGRVAASLLQAVGLPELVTDSLGAYEALALKLASDPSHLQSIRRTLAQNRLSHPLFDTDRFRRGIEAAYTTMWDIWQRGESPRSFAVDRFSGLRRSVGAATAAQISFDQEF
jgi:predicted O-linked N-acetylglucosamine transferase (SPINDLY family)